MWSLFRYLQRHHAFILFLLLEIIAFVLIFSNNDFQRAMYLNSANRISGSIYSKTSSIVDYFHLSSVNRELSEENSRLRQQLSHYISSGTDPDTLLRKQFADSLAYDYIPARVINNSVTRQHNYITLDKGARDGVEPDMGVVTPSGVAGVIIHTSESFSTAISLLNLRWNVSAKLKRNNYFGSLAWDGKDYRYALLNEIPFHVDLLKGDTIVSSGFSSIFPEGLKMGVVEDFKKEGGDNFYYIKVRLSVDFKSLSYVEIFRNTYKKEIEELEKLNSDGQDVN